MEMSIFEKASKKKLRFQCAKGSISTEDLWDVPLISNQPNFSLDDIAVSLHRELRESESESFVVKTPKVNELLKLKFDVVKRIIDVKLFEAEEAEKASLARQRKEQILSIIADKESEELKGTSLDELKKMLESL